MNSLKLFANYYRHEKKICVFFLFSRFFLLTLQILCVEVYEYI